MEFNSYPTWRCIFFLHSGHSINESAIERKPIAQRNDAILPDCSVFLRSVISGLNTQPQGHSKALDNMPLCSIVLIVHPEIEKFLLVIIYYDSLLLSI